ncbi:MAG: 1-deoxy-D-xylulose-5-phosphate reductoisomerase [Eubacteriales bacterium]
MFTDRSIAVLGSTGSIGIQALDVISRLGMHIASLSANRNVKLIEQQARLHHPAVCALADENAARDLRVRLSDTDIRVLSGEESVCEAARMGDTALNGIVGIRGLLPTLAAIDAGHNVALANKETLVCAGNLVMRRASEMGVRILPIDSEHSAVFQCLQGNERHLKRILLTCSGGAFYGMSHAQTYMLTKEDALRHPNWSMGAKITVDSATLMNKGLECIEAMRLFDVPIDRVEVLIHRESVVHSLIELTDGAMLAQLGVPDMRLPIQYALTYPVRVDCPVQPLDLTARPLTFTRPDLDAFPCLELARNAARDDDACCVLNAANEEAVRRFLNDEIPFGHIAELVSYALDRRPVQPLTSAADVLALDRETRAGLPERISV